VAEKIRAWWMALSRSFMGALVRAGFIGTVGAPPKVRDRNPATGEVKVGFRLDTRIEPELYELYSSLCKENHTNPSEQTRKLIMHWILSKVASDPWMEFVEKRKREGFSTPQEWLKEKLGLDNI